MQAEHHHQGPDDAAIGQDDSSQMRLVSVIVRSTNRAELSDTLASIARQTYPSIEVILVDVAGDGRLSTRDRCGAFALRVASAGWPLGRAAAANLGLDTATGRYAIFLDDDDWFLPEHIEGLVNALTFA
ncbi:MAG: glycosyltransferase family 2 protein, partial [Gammaproteobacteria bacterium]|nr:glycosyltransferase family 2 protein [Gammaproteobacteria bacterium]